LSRLRLSARLRIALAYGVLFFAGGLILLALVNGLVRTDLLSPSVTEVPARETDSPQQEALERNARSTVRDEALDSLLVRSGLALAGLTIVSGLAGWIVAGVVLRPVHRITDIARRASTTNLDQRVNLEGPDDELKEMADTVDSMLDRLQAGMDARRSFSANAAHELRTPLTVIRTATEVGLTGSTDETIAEVATDIRSATAQAERLIDRLLEFARSEHGIQESQVLDVPDLVQDALAKVINDADARGLHVDQHLEPVSVRGDPTLIDLAVTNLLANGVRYNRDRGCLRIETKRQAGAAVVQVTSDGQVLEPKQLDNLVRPFVRGDGSRVANGTEGTGLGLSIVQAVADAHHGSLRLEARPEGGMQATLTIQSIGPPD
jgi:signal transduction histidine kinase